LIRRRTFTSQDPQFTPSALGAGNVRNGGANSVMASDPLGYEIQISGIASTALSGGG
jgi:hypothetical protein